MTNTARRILDVIARYGFLLLPLLVVLPIVGPGLVNAVTGEWAQVWQTAAQLLH